jgi:iron complex transport system permease protein
LSRNTLILTLLLVLVGFLLASTFFIPTAVDFSDLSIYSQLRLPKYGIAFLAGGSLAIAGYLSQLLLNNPLADPYILGISGGAGISINLATFIGLPMFFCGFFMPYIYASFGALLVALLLFVKLKNYAQNISSILLFGLAINFFSSACVSLFIFLAKDSNTIRDISFWFMGSYNKVSLQDFAFVSLFVTLILVYLQTQSTKLFQLHLGLRRIQELGISTNKLFVSAIAVIVLLSALIVTSCGPIGFVGLIIPHLIRAFKFPSKLLFPITFLVGGSLTLLAELLSSAFFRQSLPPGVVTAMLGIPIFLYLLSNKYRFHI